MVRKIKVVNVYEPEETARADEDKQEEQANEPTGTTEPEAAMDETSVIAESAAETAIEEPSPKPIDMSTTSKTVEQVSCQACGKFMSVEKP